MRQWILRRNKLVEIKHSSQGSGWYFYANTDRRVWMIVCDCQTFFTAPIEEEARASFLHHRRLNGLDGVVGQ